MGLISIQGQIRRRSSGTSEKSARRPAPRRLLLERRVKAESSTERLPSPSAAGRREMRSRRICCRVIAENCSQRARNFSTVSSSVPALRRARSGSCGMVRSRKFFATFFSKPESTFSLVRRPLSRASEMKLRPSERSFRQVFLYIHQLESISMLSMRAPALEEKYSRTSSCTTLLRSAAVVRRKLSSAASKASSAFKYPSRTGRV